MQEGLTQKHLGSLLVLFIVLATLRSTAVAQPRTTPETPPAAVALQPASEPNLDGLGAFITSVMQERKVPGLAIAVVKDGQVILSKGYGYRNMEQQLPVMPQTLFAIGSITKSFTVSVLGMLADEGKLDWDTPVRTYLPDFQLHDPVATEHMTPRDLVTHGSGLPSHDALWYHASLTRKQMYDRLRHLEPSKAFRSTFQYNNLMFMTVGILAGHIAGMSWEDLVRQRLFQPLGMTHSNFSVNDSQEADDFALPYVRPEEEVKQVPFRNLDEVGPAGSINSNVEDMIRYVQFHLNKDKHGDTQLLSASNAEQMQTPQVVIPGVIRYDDLGHESYGLGFVVITYRGHKLVAHGGSIDGFISLLAFMPRQNIGTIVLTNLSGNNPVRGIVTGNVYDCLLGLEQVDWVGRTREEQAKEKKAHEAVKQKGYTPPRKAGASHSHPLSDYAGTYQHPAYSTVTIAVDGTDPKATHNQKTVPLKHWHYDIFEAPEWQGAKVTFFYNKQGDIDHLAVPIEPGVSDIVFTRMVAEAMRQTSFLEPFIGQYELGSTTVTIALRGDDTLTFTALGEPTYELVHTRGTTFDIKGRNGFSVEFKQDTAGAVTDMVFYHPQGTLVAERQ